MHWPFLFPVMSLAAEMLQISVLLPGRRSRVGAASCGSLCGTQQQHGDPPLLSPSPWPPVACAAPQECYLVTVLTATCNQPSRSWEVCLCSSREFCPWRSSPKTLPVTASAAPSQEVKSCVDHLWVREAAETQLWGDFTCPSLQGAPSLSRHPHDQRHLALLSGNWAQTPESSTVPLVSSFFLGPWVDW